MHLVHHGIPAWHCRGEVLNGDFHVGSLARLFKRLLDERVVIGGPVRADRQRSEDFVIVGQFGASGEFVDERLVNLVAAPAFVEVELRDGNKVFFLFHV